MSSSEKKALTQYFATPWYLQTWLIGLLYASWFLIIPLIPAVVLTILQWQDRQAKQHRVKELNLDKLADLDVLERELEQKQQHREDIDTLEETRRNLSQEQQKLKGVVTETESVSEKLIEAQSELEMQEYGFYPAAFEFDTSAEYKAKLIGLQEQEKRMVKEDTACTQPGDFTFNGSKSEGRKMVKKQKKLTLWAFNTHCDNVMMNVTYRNYGASQKRIQRAFELINDSNSLVAINPEYLALKFQELEVTFKYKEMKEREKELLREQRAKEREEQKLKREIEAERAKIEKDESHVKTELSRLQKLLLEGRGQKAVLDKEIAALESKLTDLDEEKQAVEERAANATAGYVYVISNIGSFGNEIVKIGVTRRLEPLERINELGDASVPFRYDIHALVFSEDAYRLEKKLHHTFSKQRLNLVNNRREFFRVTLEQVQEVITRESKTVEFITEVPAREYRESLKLANSKAAKKTARPSSQVAAESKHG